MAYNERRNRPYTVALYSDGELANTEHSYDFSEAVRFYVCCR